MNRWKWLGLFAGLLAVAACGRPCPQMPAVIPLKQPVAAEVSVEQLQRMLPAHPVVVGFDVDDTLIFSAPAFNALQPQYDPDVIRPKSLVALTPAQRAKYYEFWDRLNKEYDERSQPLELGRKLLAMHMARGDTIYIISKRQSPSDGSDPCTPRYERMFGIKLQHPVIQTQLQDKTPYICRCHIEYYYGDSDSDITSAVAAGATPIRVKRRADSYAKDTPHNGQLNEIVLQDSRQQQ